MEGVTANLAAAGGISAYDDSSLMVRLPHPDGTRNKFAGTTAPSVFVAGAAQPTARSTTVLGTVTKPSTPNGYIYECTATTGVYGTEPTWPTTPGASVVDDQTNTWTCRREDTYMGNFKGVTIDADLNENSIEQFYLAIKADDSLDHGDSAALTVV